MEIHLAAPAAATAGSGETGGERRRPGAHPLPGNDRRALGTRPWPQPRRGGKGSAGQAGSRQAGRERSTAEAPGLIKLSGLNSKEKGSAKV